MDPVRVWADGDFALGLPDTAVDDALALAALARGVQQGRVEIAGVSAVAGQVDATTAFHVARDVLWAAGLETPVYEAHVAPDAMAACPGEVSVLAFGPVTNLVGAAMLDPGFPRRAVARAVMSVGAAWRRPARPLLDPNTRVNPVASEALASAPFRALRVFPVDVAGQLRLDADDILRLDALGGRLGRLLATGAQWWVRRSRWRHPRGGFPARDLVPALDVLRLLPAAEFTGGGTLLSFDAAAARAAALDLFDQPG